MLNIHLKVGLATVAMLVAAFCGGRAGAAEPPLQLHVASPDWRDQIMYFVLIDRFADGDTANNDQGAGEFKAGDASRYNGGDLAGLVHRLDYIRGLGATALWVTPPVANQWLDPSRTSAGYHGYWAENFMQIDRHLGTLADYQRLSGALHAAGMYLVQDIVVNHTGNYFAYRGNWDAADPARFYDPHDTSPPVPRPSQPPFDRNDPRDPAQRRAGIYHWTPDVADYRNRRQELNFQMSGLDDLNTENPTVRRALRQSYGHWIRQAGVDAFRVDTAFYVPPSYFNDFLHGRDTTAPGIVEVARRTGRQHFLVFGEGFGIDRPGQDRQMLKIERYMTGPAGRPLLPGMLNFPLYGALGDVFARGRPPAELGGRIEKMMTLHARPHLMPSFVDNHDVDRFLAGGSVAALEQALLAIMTLPGIPVIYYGTEQGFKEPRAAMFAAGWASGGSDRYDTTAPLYRRIAEFSALRRGHRVFSRGRPVVLAGEATQAGALAWRMDRPGTRKGSALVVFNTAASEVLVADLRTGLPAGTRLEGLYGLDGRPADVVAGAGGRVTLRLPPHSGQIWLGAGSGGAAPSQGPRPTLSLLRGAARQGDFAVAGTAAPGAELRLVVDGDLAAARALRAGSDGRWQSLVDTSRMVDPEVRHRVTAWSANQGAAVPRTFRVVRDWRLAADVADPAGDDHGPEGRYTRPSAPGYGQQMDIRHIRAWTAGTALRLELTMGEITRDWNPPFGFDHVAFTIFVELPGRDGGATVMPLQDTSLPEGMRWHLRLRAHGFANALFIAEGASDSNEGRAATQAADIRTDAAKRSITFTLPAHVFGSADTLAGARIYVTTWDYDGGYRALKPEAGPYVFGGGSADAPKVMDASAVVKLH